MKIHFALVPVLLALTLPAHAAMEMEGMEHSSHATHRAVPAAVPVTLAFPSDQKLTIGKPTQIVVSLTDTTTGKGLRLRDFKEVHTKRVHLMLIDPTFTDYHHIHPQETDVAGQYRFTFVPKYADYRAWADVTPMSTGKQAFITADIGKPRPLAPRKQPSSLSASVNGMEFKLAADKPLLTGDATMLNLTVSKDGKPVTRLEPIMGAYAHMVAFHDDYKTLMHIHPMGAEPTSATDRGGPTLGFHVEPEKAGTLHVFVQAIVDGKEMVVPFVLDVATAAHKH